MSNGGVNEPLLFDMISKSGNRTLSDLQFIPLIVAAGLRETIGGAIGAQFYADVLIGVIFVLAFGVLLWRLTCSTFRVSKHLLAICTTIPLAALSLLGVLTLGALIWAIYQLSLRQFPGEHAAITQTLALMCGVVVDLTMRVGALFLRSTPGG